MPSQNIYEYNKIKPLDIKEVLAKINEECPNGRFNIEAIIRGLINKINELTIEQNHLMKDFELYKKAFTRHLKVDHDLG